MDVGRDNVAGVYNLSSPQLELELPEQAANFCLFLHKEEHTIWGGFELGLRSGVLHADNLKINEPEAFGWRARDTADVSALTFGRRCYGEIELYGGQYVRGCCYNMSPGSPWSSTDSAGRAYLGAAGARTTFARSGMGL